jgi:tRNA pseudouridine55 synthase
MERETENPFSAGRVLLFDKPLYWTSFDLVNKIRIMLRSTFGIKKIKVGHAGTLDPLASGLMIVCTGKATKKIEEYMAFDKEYIATLCAGRTTPSFDLETETDAEFPTSHITRELAEQTLEKFIGVQQQIPPLHSAKYVNGKRAYEFARKGIDMELKAVEVNIKEARLTDFSLPELKVRILCGKGTYIRSFARDYGRALQSGCCLTGLVRSSIGSFTLKEAFSLESFAEYLEEMKQNGVFPV